MGEFACINGNITKSDEATVSIFDPGFMFGDGLFETFRVYKSRPFLFDRHLERLAKGLMALEINNAPGSEILTKYVESTIDANGSDDCVVRLTVTRGTDSPTTVVTTRSVPYLKEQYENGESCITVPETRGALTAVKSLNYLPNRLAKLAADHAGALEAIFQTNSGMLTEGTMSSVFIYADGFLRTPDLSLGILNGITRRIVLRLAKESGINYAESAVMSETLYQADEVFITNSVAEIMPIVKVDGCNVGDGRPGQVTRSLLERYRELT